MQGIAQEEANESPLLPVVFETSQRRAVGHPPALESWHGKMRRVDALAARIDDTNVRRGWTFHSVRIVDIVKIVAPGIGGVGLVWAQLQGLTGASPAPSIRAASHSTVSASRAAQVRLASTRALSARKRLKAATFCVHDPAAPGTCRRARRRRPRRGRGRCPATVVASRGWLRFHSRAGSGENRPGRRHHGIRPTNIRRADAVQVAEMQLPHLGKQRTPNPLPIGAYLQQGNSGSRCRARMSSREGVEGCGRVHVEAHQAVKRRRLARVPPRRLNPRIPKRFGWWQRLEVRGQPGTCRLAEGLRPWIPGPEG